MFYYKLANIVANIYTPFKYRQELLRKWLLSFVPLYIHSVIYIPEDYNKYSTIYTYDEYKEFEKLHEYSFNEGYYLFTFWNNEKYKVEKLVLHSNHIKKALNISDLNYLWAFNESSMIKLLLKYQQKHTLTTLLDISVNNESVYDILKDYIRSFEVSKNITPRLIYIIKQIETKNTNIEIENVNVTYFDILMEDVKKKNDEYLI